MKKTVDPEALESLPNIGKVTAAKLRAVGITTRSDFLKSDPFDVFDKLKKKVDPTLCRCALASLVGAKKDALWHVITKETAKEYQRRHPKHKWSGC
jgi:nucleotidyltransferase/DNA polymerase involved in DNA repair